MPKYEEAHKEHINKYKMAHMIGVAEYMRERAEDYGIDPNLAYTVGLLHDIGYLVNRNQHEMHGCKILFDLGVTNQDVLNSVLYHGSNPYELEAKDISPLLVLAYEADLSIDAEGHRVGFDKRLKDIEIRLKGTEYYDDAVKTSQSAVAFVKEWQEEHNVPRPPKGFFQRMNKEEHNK